MRRHSTGEEYLDQRFHRSHIFGSRSSVSSRSRPRSTSRRGVCLDEITWPKHRIRARYPRVLSANTRVQYSVRRQMCNILISVCKLYQQQEYSRHIKLQDLFTDCVFKISSDFAATAVSTTKAFTSFHHYYHTIEQSYQCSIRHNCMTCLGVGEIKWTLRWASIILKFAIYIDAFPHRNSRNSFITAVGKAVWSGIRRMFAGWRPTAR